MSADMTEVSRAERIFRGMLGMGMAFSVVGGAVVAAMILGALLFGGEQLNKGGMAAITFILLSGVAISFGMGMLYAVFLALLARGRKFSQVSIAHVAAAGAAVGVIPLLIVLSIIANTGKGTELLTALSIFPPITALIGSATLLIARRAKPELAAADEQGQIRHSSDSPA